MTDNSEFIIENTHDKNYPYAFKHVVTQRYLGSHQNGLFKHTHFVAKSEKISDHEKFQLKCLATFNTSV